MPIAFVEYTDTFGGEANYCWVQREDFPVEPGTSRAAIMRRAKAAVGLSGVRGKSEDYGDMIKFTPYRMCTVMFITFAY